MITLPKATYIVIDPCYVMRDDAYDVLCDKMDLIHALKSLKSKDTRWLSQTLLGEMDVMIQT